jgi:CheY-like chemotaxis protein
LSSLPTVLSSRGAPPRRSARYRDDIHKARALVVDANPTTRSVLAAQLRELGVSQVSQCARIAEARQRLEKTRFDIVLCEHDFPDGGGTGQQLLDDLRRHQLLPLTTVFVMVTSQATYAKVAEAAESALDSYLIKPHNTASLAGRLAHARRRKTVLRAILEAVDEGRFAEATELCLQRFRSRGEYWLYAARIGSELLLNLERHDEARELFDAVLASRALPWAKLGVARAQIEGGEVVRAMRTLESLILEQPTFVDAYDVMGRARLEQGDFDGAMEVYLRAVALTPESVTRLQKAGMLAYYRGDLDEAAKALERALGMGIGSKMFDWQSAVLLAFVRFDQGDARGLQRCCDEIDAAAARVRSSRRLQRLSQVVTALLLMLQRRTGDSLECLRALSDEVDAPDFDIEAACNLTTLLALLAAHDSAIDGAEDWIDRIALRHTGSRILTELLARAARAHPPFAERIQAGHVKVGRLAEDALAHALRGQATQAVRQLLADAESTLSYKLLETARMTLQRHRDRVTDADELDAAIVDLRQRMAPLRSPLVESNGRKPGALVLRRTSGRAPHLAAGGAALLAEAVPDAMAVPTAGTIGLPEPAR